MTSQERVLTACAFRHGPVERIQAEAREIIDLGRKGGIVIGTHSVSPEVPIEHFAAYHETCLTDGNFIA